MNHYQLIACDLDGTLIDSNLALSKENRDAIKELTDRGILVVPATGRTVCEMNEIFHLPGIRYVIYSNGAAIYDKLTDESTLFGLEGRNSYFILDVLKHYDVFTIVHKNGKSYSPKEKIAAIHQYHVSFAVENMIKKYCISDENLEKIFLGKGIECVSIFFADKEDINACRSDLSVNQDLYIVEGWDYNLEIFLKNAGKDNALKFLAKKLNLKMEQVISVGDSDNDRKMTLLSGLGLAVENACDSLKQVADQVICSNDEHVIQYIKDHYFE